MSHRHPCTSDEHRQMAAACAEFPSLGHVLQDCLTMKPGSTGRVFLVETTRGIFLIKEVGRGFSLPALEFAFLVQEKLFEQGFPCSRPLRTAEGKWFTHDGAFTAQTFLAGSHLTSSPGNGPDETLAARLGTLIGRLHGVLKDAELPRAPDNRRQKRMSAIIQAQIGTEDFFRSPLLRPSLYTRWRFRFPQSDLDREIVRALPMLREAVAHLVTWATDQGENLGKLFPTHGDLNWENILADEDGSLFLIDFDNVIMQPRLFELGGAAAILTPHENRAREAFLDAYAATGWERPDKDMIRHLAQLKYARSLNWQIAHWYQGGKQNEEKERWIRFLLKGLETHWSLVQP